MSTLKALRSRIKSVRATQKITTAMKLVSAAKLRRAQEQLNAFLTYSECVEDVWQKLLKAIYNEDIPNWLASHSNGRKLIITFMADRGLCGSYNANMARYVCKKVEDDQASFAKVDVLPLGFRAIDMLKRDLGSHFVALLFASKEQKVTFRQILDKATRFLIDHLKATPYQSVEIVYTSFESILKQTIETKELLIQRPEFIESGFPPIFEPNRKELMEELSPTYLKNILRFSYLEAQASEQASRMRAMDTATTNANDVLLRLKRTYNRTRQAGITRELIEIVSGANALQS